MKSTKKSPEKIFSVGWALGGKMAHTHPDWHKLIKAWLGKGRYGLSIPFLVGARALLTGSKTVNRDDIENLLAEIIERPVQGNIVYIRWCDDYDSAVLASYSENFPFRPKDNVIEFSPKGSTETSLGILREVPIKLGVTAERAKIIPALVEYANAQVSLAHYSRYWTEDGRTYGPFQEEELSFIQATFSDHSA
jgi:hypothetical protein